MTTVAPVGVAAKYETISPTTKATMENKTDSMVAPLNVLASDIAERAGKIIRLEMRREPSKRMPSTTTAEQMIAKRMS